MPTWKRQDDWVGTQVDEEFVMINVESGRYVALNSTAAAVWELMADPQEENALVTRLTRDFDVDRETCALSVSRAMTRMKELGMADEVA
jgi:translation initiation factor IF-2